jgi:hypothetical protein
VVRRWSVGIVAVIGWAREPGGDGILFACWLSMMRQMMASSSRWIEYRCHFYHSVEGDTRQRGRLYAKLIMNIYHIVF